ncbi:MAG TPA: hypothetical protein VN618_12730 [Solirubrobacteraceae bacterium]|nr:hypothetical protein [Solirubrobacteraceae bacterium]
MADAQETLEAPPEVQEDVVEAPAPAKAAKPAKEKKKDEKKGKKGKAAIVEIDGPSVAGHPRAARAVERAKAWGALVGFGAGFYESLPTHTFATTMLRALVAGIALFLAAWAGSVFFWRRMVMVEIKAREQELVAAARAAQARRAAAEGAQGAGGR